MTTICIAGKNQIAVNALQYLTFDLKETVLCLPNPEDDGRDGWQPSMRRWAGMHGLKIVSLDEIYDIPDLLFISLEYSAIIKPERFASSRLFNIHFSLLPKYKGMYTSVFPLLHGESHSGVTLHRIDRGIDTGEIVDQVSFELTIDTTCRELYHLYLDFGYKLFVKNFDKLLTSDVASQAQPSIGASYFSKSSLDFKNLIIDYRKTAFEVHNQIRAFTFREYQLPKYRDFEISSSYITGAPSILRPGEIVKNGFAEVEIATVDYNMILKKDFYSSLWRAAEIGDTATVEQVLKYVPDINLKNRFGWSALIIAAYNGWTEIIKTLIEHGADIGDTNFNGTTVLMYAFSHYEKTRSSDVYRTLLNLGADPLAQDASGKTVRDYMRERQCLDLLDLN